MKPTLSFVCPLTRDDFIGEGALRHCPRCNLDIPDMTVLTVDEARRVLGALSCGQELSGDLHFCSSYWVDADGDAAFFDPEQIDARGIDLSGLVDTTPKLLLAIAALSTLGLTAQIHVFEHVFTPLWQGHEVFVLDGDGPRFEPERVDAFTHAVDASEDAWLTLNLATWRDDALSAIGALFPHTVETKFTAGANTGVDHEVMF